MLTNPETITGIIQHHRGTTEDWLKSNYVPAEGELVIEECVDGLCRVKVGDGIHIFSSLSYIDAITEAELDALATRLDKHILDNKLTDTAVTNLKREVDGISTAVQSLVQPSIDSLDVKYSAKLTELEKKHIADFEELSEKIAERTSELETAFEADVVEAKKEATKAIDTKASELSTKYSTELKMTEAALSKQLIDIKTKQQTDETLLSSLDQQLKDVRTSLSDSVIKIAAGEASIEALNAEVAQLKELGFGDIVTSEMIGKLRAVEAKVEQLHTNDINVISKMYEVDAALERANRQLKDLKEAHATDKATLTSNFSSIKEELYAADEANLAKLNEEFVKLWAEITDLVDDDISLYESIATTRSQLSKQLKAYNAAAEKATSDLRAEFNETITNIDTSLKTFVDERFNSLAADLEATEADLTTRVGTLQNNYDYATRSLEESVQTLSEDIEAKHTESQEKIAEVAGAVTEHRAQTNASFSDVTKKLNQVNKRADNLDTKILIERERVNSQAKQISQLVRLEEGSTTGDGELMNIRIGYDGTEYTKAGDAVRAIGTELRDLKNDAVTGLFYDYEGKVGLAQPYMLYLQKGDEIVEDSGVQIISGAGGGGGTGGTTATSTLKIGYITQSPLVVTSSEEAKLYFSFEGTDSSGDPILQANATWKVDGKTVEQGIVKYGDNNYFDATKYLPTNSGTIKVFLSVTDDNGSVVTKSWSVQKIALALESDFNDKIKYPAGEPVIFDFIPTGAVEKIVFAELDGNPLNPVTLDAQVSGTTATIEIPAQSHGAHFLKVWMEAEVNGEWVPSNSIVKDIIWYDANSTEPVIASTAKSLTAAQYSTTNITYTVYDPSTENPTVNIELDGRIVSTAEIAPNKVYDDTPTAVYSYVADGVGSHTIKIICGTTVKVINVDVTDIGIVITPVTTGLAFDFNPVGRTNGDEASRSWQDRGVSMTVSEDFDWVNGGYIPNDPDGPCFCIKAGSRAEIDYKLFADDAKVNGKEFKFVFKTKNVANPDAVFLSCVDNTTATNHIGVEMGTQAARIYGETGNLELTYSENDVIEFEFNISRSNEAVPMIMGYEDGVPSRPKIYDRTYSFKQNTPKTITLGSDYCDLYIYRFKVYKNSLSAADVLKNFTADARTAEEMVSRYYRNLIYDENTQLSPEVLAEKCPWLRVYKVSAPYFTNNKSDKVPGTTIQQIYKNGDSVLDNWTCYNALHSGQGTSSNDYGAAGRNLDFIMNEPTSYFELGNGTVAKEITLTRTSVPVAYLNAKVNIASSNNLTNAMLARHYNKFNRYKRPFTERTSVNGYYDINEKGELVKRTDIPIANIKDTMEFYNCVIFVQETDPNISNHREFADKDWHFYAIGNIGDSKKTDNTRATDPTDLRECCVEIMDIGRPLSGFPVDTMVPGHYINEDTGDVHYTWSTQENLDLGLLYEREYQLTEDLKINPYKTYYVDNSGEKVPATANDLSAENLSNLYDAYYFPATDDTLASAEQKTYYADVLVNDDFSEDYTYGWRYLTNKKDQAAKEACKQAWIDFYRFVTTSTDDDFKNNLENYFAVDSALYYYLFTTRYCMVDNRAKNTFWHYGKAADGSYKWDLCWDYDNDTSLGLDNYGRQVYRYGLEDTDYDEAGQEVFRQSDSVFFSRIRELFGTELKDMYQKLETAGAWNAETFIQDCDAWQEQFPEALWYADIERKYIRTYNSSFINGAGDNKFLTNMSHGKMKYHRRQWERNQEQYMASKYQTTKALGDTASASFRVNSGFQSTDNLVVKPNYQLTITPFAYTYLNVDYGAGSKPVSVRAVPNEPTVVPYSGNSADIINVGSAASIRSFGNLSALYPDIVSVQNATRIRSLQVGSNISGYENDAFSSLSLGDNSLLEELDMTNVSGYNVSLDLEENNLVNLRRLYLSGTSVPSVIFATGSKLEHVELPAVGSLELKKLPYLSTELDPVTSQSHFVLDSYENVTKLNIEECPLINQLQIFESCTTLIQVKLDNINFGTKTYEYFRDNVFKLKGVDDGRDNAQLTGTVTFESLTGAQYNEIASRYPGLQISFNALAATVTFVYEYQDPSNPDLTVKTTITDIVNCEDSSFGISNFVPNSQQMPYWKENSAFEYEFVGWSTEEQISKNEADSEDDYLKYFDENALSKIKGDCTFYPVFKANRKSYPVTFINPTAPAGTPALQESDIPYGTSVEEAYKGPTLSKLDALANANLYDHVGWIDETGEIVTKITSSIVLYAKFNPKVFVMGAQHLVTDGYKIVNDTISFNLTTGLKDKASIGVPSGLDVEGDKRKVIGIGGFKGLNNLELIDLPEGVLEILTGKQSSVGAFEGCSSLAEITLPSTLMSIGNKSFSECSKLKSIHIPANVSTIGYAAFAQCTNLESITVDSSNPYFKIQNNCLVEELTNGSYRLIQALSDAEIPDGTSILDQNCFTAVPVTKVTMPDTVTTLNSYAFGECTTLEEIELSTAIGRIPASCFSGCTALKKVNLDDLLNLTEIGTFAFNNCILTSIIIPSRVNSIGNSAFKVNKGKVAKLEATFEARTELPNIHNSAFAGVPHITFNLPWTKDQHVEKYGYGGYNLEYPNIWGADSATINFEGGTKVEVPKI